MQLGFFIRGRNVRFHVALNYLGSMQVLVRVGLRCVLKLVLLVIVLDCLGQLGGVDKLKSMFPVQPGKL